VQGVIEEVLVQVLGLDEVKLQGAGRTDAGVHARGQVASFSAAIALPPVALAPLLNQRLPDDVRVRAAIETDATFHARHSARARRYSYRLLAEDDVLLGRFAWRPPRPFRPEPLACATAALECTANFSAFRAAGSSPAEPVCRVTRASWERWEGGLRLDIVSDHFLYHMVRNVVGTALAAAETPDPGATMRAILESRERSRAGITAPAHGLCLEQVFYEEAA